MYSVKRVYIDTCLFIHNNFQIKPNTIFLAHVRRMHWVCIINIYLSSNTRNIDKELYVVYDCFTEGSSSCSTHVDWLNGFSFLLRNCHRI